MNPSLVNVPMGTVGPTEPLLSRLLDMPHRQLENLLDMPHRQLENTEAAQIQVRQVLSAAVSNIQHGTSPIKNTQHETSPITNSSSQRLSNKE